MSRSCTSFTACCVAVSHSGRTYDPAVSTVAFSALDDFVGAVEVSEARHMLAVSFVDLFSFHHFGSALDPTAVCCMKGVRGVGVCNK